MFSVRIPMPVFFATVAFALLLVEPEIGSTASRIATPCAAPSSTRTEENVELWLGYRAANRQWTVARPAALGGTVSPVSLR